MTQTIRAGVQLSPGGTPDYATWRQAVLDAEKLGMDAIFGYDHFHRPLMDGDRARIELIAESPEVNNFESWTALASWGELTTRCEIGLLVTAVSYRNPDLLADMARTVDHISHGRLILGLGAGWYEKDYTLYGYDFGTLASRMALFGEALARIEHRLQNLFPPPTRPIPILVGGSGEHKTLPLVGRYAHIWHSSLDPATFQRKNALVSQYASAAGRDDGEIERAVAWSDPKTADALLDQGATLFTIEIAPKGGRYDLTQLEELIAWRDAHR